MAVNYTGPGNDDGEVMGRSSGKIGFYGASAPVVQATVTQITTTATGDELAVTVKAIITALGNMNMIATS